MAFAPFPAPAYLSDGSRTEGEMKTAFENWLLATKQTGGHGECRLVRTGATTLSLLPYNGRRVLVAGQPYLVPASGLTITNAGLLASTGYYVTLADLALNGAVTLELIYIGGSVTRGTDPESGVETILNSGTPDTRYTMVGIAFTTAGAQFQETGVSSWFNREPAVSLTNLAADMPMSSATPTTVIGISGMGWKGDQMETGGILALYRDVAGTATVAGSLTGTGVAPQGSPLDVDGAHWGCLAINNRMILATDSFWQAELRVALYTNAIVVKTQSSLSVSRLA